jgi:hypothetical protein
MAVSRGNTNKVNGEVHSILVQSIADSCRLIGRPKFYVMDLDGWENLSLTQTEED